MTLLDKLEYRLGSITKAMRQTSRSEQKKQCFISLAMNLGALSTCQRAQVGAVIIAEDLTEVLSIGYNGPPAGTPNDSCAAGEGTCGCIHAEANALIKLSDRRPAILITTTSPCHQCAGLIINRRNITGVIYVNSYRDTTPIHMLRQQNVSVIKSRAVYHELGQSNARGPQQHG